MLELFWTFFKIGLFTIGGGYAMIPVIESEMLAHGWLTQETFTDFVAISESTPGPIAVNTATLVGADLYGVPGAIIATLGVILPSFIIILVISMFVTAFLKNRVVGYAMYGVKPVVIGLITAFAISLIRTNVIVGGDGLGVDIVSLFITIFVFTVMRLKKNVSPILMILISALLGIFFYYLI